MAIHNFIVTTGTATWNAAAFDSGVLPANGDTVNVAQGNADIMLGLAQSGVTLAALNFVGSFSGTVADANLGPLAIGVSGTIIVNCKATRIVLNYGSTSPLVIVGQTGSSQDDPLEAVRIRGGGAATKLYVSGDTTTVGVATDKATLTATLAEWDIQGGTLNIAAGVTWTNGYQDGLSTANVASGGTLIAQSGQQATLNTSGSGAIATIDMTGTATLNHRPAAGTDATATINAGPNSTVDFSTDPRPLTITNPINAAIGCTIKAFDPQQIAMHSGGPVQVRTQQCGLVDVTLDFGSPVLTTIAPG
jgi:hypothetical protein